MKNYIAVLILFSQVMVPAAHAQQNDTPELVSFEFIGCSGDLEGPDSTPEIWRVMANGKVSFLTHTVAACGLAGRAPTVSGSTSSIDLSYELYSPSDVAIMCDCEYWAKFTFGPEAHTVSSVTFGGYPAVLKGTWPER